MYQSSFDKICKGRKKEKEMKGERKKERKKKGGVAFLFFSVICLLSVSSGPKKSF